jgi:membrane-associated protease RseP (regulator of RpoE activity)
MMEHGRDDTERRPDDERSREVTLLIANIAEGSPAESAGVMAGDTLVRIDGRPADRSSFDLLARELEVGDTVTLTVRRSGRDRDFTLVAAERPAMAFSFSRPALEAMELQIDSVRNLVFRNMDSIRVVIGDVDGQRALLRLQVDSLRSADARLRALRADTLDGRLPFIFHRDSLMEGRARVWEFRGDSLQQRARELALEARRAFPGEPGVTMFGPAGAMAFAPAVAGRHVVAGAQMIELNPGLADYLDVEDGGVFVVEVIEGSPAHDAGLRAGDVIVRMNERPVRSLADVRAELNVSGRAESATSVDVSRRDERLQLTLPR